MLLKLRTFEIIRLEIKSIQFLIFLCFRLFDVEVLVAANIYLWFIILKLILEIKKK